MEVDQRASEADVKAERRSLIICWPPVVTPNWAMTRILKPQRSGRFLPLGSSSPLAPGTNRFGSPLALTRWLTLYRIPAWGGPAFRNLREKALVVRARSRK